MEGHITLKQIFVLGWYGHNNLGDEAFKQAFIDLWGDKVSFTFGTSVPDDLEKYDACFVGGGSFLDQEVTGLKDIKIPLGFIGVGIHSYIHPQNVNALKRAKIVIARDVSSKSPVEVHQASDLVFARNLEPQGQPNKEILIIGNEFLSPRRHDPIWKHTSFNWFLSVFSKLCDTWIKEGYAVKFYPMCTGDKYDDRFFLSHIASQMSEKSVFHFGDANENEFIQNISSAKLVVSMRYHSSVFSTILGRQFIGINSHDKMNAFFRALGLDNFLNYYGFTSFAFQSCVAKNKINTEYLLEYAQKEKNRWRYLSDIVADVFAM